MQKTLLITLACLSSLVICSCKPIFFESTWKTFEINIDGNSGEWKQLSQFTKDDRFGIGVSNDDKFLYLCLSLWDRQTSMQMMSTGLNIWFETKSQKNRKFGIHFPLGIMKSGQSSFVQGKHNQDPEQMKEFIDEATQEMEILGPGKNDSRIIKKVIAESFGISAKILFSNGNTVYELKIPLNQDSLCPFAINTVNDSLIKLSLETTKPDFDKMGRPPTKGNRMPPRGDMGGGDMRPGSPPGIAPSMPEQFRMELVIKLARTLN